MYPLYLITFMVQLGMGIVSPILPEIMEDFRLAAWQVGLVVTVFGLARLMVDLPLGMYLERIDRVRILILGTLLIVAGSFIAATANSYNLFLAGRLAMGMGSAICTITTLFSLSRRATATSRGRVIGVHQAAMLAGATFSPMIGGLAATLAGWRSAFLFCSLTGAAAMLLVIVSSALGSLSLAASPTQKEETGADPKEEGGKRQLPWDLVSINLTTFVLFLSVAGFRNSMVPVYGGNELGISAGTLGLLLGGSAVIRFVVTLISGFASDRYGRKVILIPGVLSLAIGSLGFLLVQTPWDFALCLVILSLGGFGNSVPTTMIVDAVPGNRVGMAISLNRFIGDFGMLVGPVALGWVLDVAGFPTVASITAALLVATIPGVAIAVRERRSPGRADSAGISQGPE